MAKIVFCQRVVFSYFGVMMLSAVLKRDGHQTELIMESDEAKVIDEIISIHPDMVMFSTVTATGDFEWAVEIAGKLKTIAPATLMI
ncbi:MAG: cobalamin B12-binding domain-containing protein, partial [Candidatus Omnitrophica bacterium]|nr:cobalamin B12-binding domain-containing protein [Candidatus Omnitrophota bacterium]